jgi:dTDP-4-amino-4,6-dideoxygalactose transaminase
MLLIGMSQINVLSEFNGIKISRGKADSDEKNAQSPKSKNQSYQCRVVGGEVAEDWFNRGLCLPSGTAMTEDDLDRVIEAILRCKR